MIVAHSHASQWVFKGMVEGIEIPIYTGYLKRIEIFVQHSSYNLLCLWV